MWRGGRGFPRLDGVAAAAEFARLADPVLAVNAALNSVQPPSDTLDIVVGHIGNLLVTENAQLVQRPLDRGPDALYRLQIVSQRLSILVAACFVRRRRTNPAFGGIIRGVAAVGKRIGLINGLDRSPLTAALPQLLDTPAGGNQFRLELQRFFVTNPVTLDQRRQAFLPAFELVAELKNLEVLLPITVRVFRTRRALVFRFATRYSFLLIS